LNMPVMDGWQFRAEQRRLVEPDLVDIPVLILTGADGADQRAATSAAVRTIGKPFVESMRSLIIGSHESRRFPACGGATCDTE
jgi:CheY-like chemotaxis protein